MPDNKRTARGFGLTAPPLSVAFAADGPIEPDVRRDNAWYRVGRRPVDPAPAAQHPQPSSRAESCGTFVAVHQASRYSRVWVR